MSQDDKRILHGNQAKIEKDENTILPQSFRASSEPEQFGFKTLPGSPEDLKKARSEYKDGFKKQQGN